MSESLLETLLGKEAIAKLSKSYEKFLTKESFILKHLKENEMAVHRKKRKKKKGKK